MKIHKRDKETGKEMLLTVDQFLADIKALGDTTKHRQLMALATLVEGYFYQDLKVAYYILAAITKSARDELARTRVE